VTVERAEKYVRPLLNYARDEVRAYEAFGALHRGEVAPEEVVDEALSDALQHDLKRPQRIYPQLRKLVRRVPPHRYGA
jgi:hypothetical protein